MSSSRLFDLTGKVVWVVGGAGWLGAPSARALASAGAHVVISGRDGDRLADVVSAIQAEGHSAESAVVDARDEEAVGALAADIVRNSSVDHAGSVTVARPRRIGAAEPSVGGQRSLRPVGASRCGWMAFVGAVAARAGARVHRRHGVAWALRHGWRPPLRLWAGVALFGSALLVLIFASHRPGVAVMDVVTTLTAPVMTMASAVLIAGAAVTSLLGRRSWMASSLMGRLGTWSFAFYLVHESVIYPARAMLGITSGVAGAAVAIAVFAVALALSVALYRYVEHPAERAIRSWTDRRDARGTTAASARRELNSYYRR